MAPLPKLISSSPYQTTSPLQPHHPSTPPMVTRLSLAMRSSARTSLATASAPLAITTTKDAPVQLPKKSKYLIQLPSSVKWPSVTSWLGSLEPLEHRLMCYNPTWIIEKQQAHLEPNASIPKCRTPLWPPLLCSLDSHTMTNLDTAQIDTASNDTTRVQDPMWLLPIDQMQLAFDQTSS